MNEAEDGKARQLLNAVERILADTGHLIAVGEEARKRAAASGGAEDAILSRATKDVVAHFSNRTAFAGGAAALPAMLPGVGTAAALAGGALADVAFLLKFEVEMALVLSHLHGYDIRNESERKLAFLLASISTQDAQAGGNFLADVAKAEKVAIWSYAPREASRLLLITLSRLLLRQGARGIFRAIPLVGIGVGAALNKTLTTRVGERCAEELARRHRTQPPAATNDDVIDAHVRTGTEGPTP